MTSLLIGVTGKKRHGKDTFAARLIEAHGFTRIAFADPLKETILDVDPWVRVEPDEAGLVLGSGSLQLTIRHERLSTVVNHLGWEKAKEVREVRRLLQAHGVAMREHLDPDVWVDAALSKAAAIPGPVVITDVRFPNEFERVKWDGGLVVRVWRPGVENADEHISETALDHVEPDFFVENKGTVADLHRQADLVLADAGLALPAQL
jgi:hypothetical protein